MTKPMTSHEIRAQLSALAIHVEVSEETARLLAYDAVSGDKEKASELAALNAEIRRAKADREVLEQALATAREKEAAAAAADDAAERAVALADARRHAGELIELAAEADREIAAFLEITSRMDAKEREVWDALRSAKSTANGQIIGRNGLAETAVERLEMKVRGLRLSDQRTVAEIAGVAWKFLEEARNG